MPKSFANKIITVTIVLADGDFGGQGNTLTIPGGHGGLTMSVDVEKPGQPDNNKASLRITGLSYEHMDQLTTLGFGPQESQKNLLKVEAGTEDSQTVLFEGEITSAWADFNSVPDPEMQIEAESGSYPAQLPEEPVSVNGDTPASDLMEKIAGAIGYSFSNQGVTAPMRNSYLTGSPIVKLRQIARETGTELIIDDREIILLPGDGTAREGNAVLLNKDSGLIGYPTFNQDGISVKCLFNPDLKQGGLLAVESIVPKATGTWKITKLSHSLSSTDAWTSEADAEYTGKGGGDGAGEDR
jgi:hypothetical protein